MHRKIEETLEREKMLIRLKELRLERLFHRVTVWNAVTR